MQERIDGTDAGRARAVGSGSLLLKSTRLLPLPENRAGLLAVRRVVAGLGRRRRAVNPLFLHGPAGSGKTLLVAELVEAATHQVRDLVVAATTAGDWAAEQGLPDGECAVRLCDLSVVEDLQYLPTRVGGALARWFDDLLARRVQMVFTAHAGPGALDLPARLAGRLAGGVVVGLEPLGVASRRSLLEAKARQRRLNLDGALLDWLAERLGTGREIDGALARLEALARANGRTPELAQVAELFREQAEAGRPTVERIARRVGGRFRVRARDLQSARRGRDVLLPRQVGMYLARQLTALSLEQIGAYFGGRDHSTVLHACRKVERALAADTALSGTVRQLRAELT
jgi:chromosomal replication initiator protein